jgi:hypothetical protein
MEAERLWPVESTEASKSTIATPIFENNPALKIPPM